MLKNRFFILFLLTVLIILSPVFLISIFFDSGNIYFQDYLANANIKYYIKKLKSSQTGVVDNINERRVKFWLSRELDQYDCIILGSSHIMSMGTVRRIPGALCSICNSSMNLGVSGNSFEDILIFSYNILKYTTSSTKRIFIGLDPWTFKWNMDARWKMYSRYYELMTSDLGRNQHGTSKPYSYDLMVNMINFEYFTESLKKAIRSDFKIEQKFKNAPDFDYAEGYSEPVILTDGSRVYSRDYLRNRTSESYVSNGNYKLSGKYYDEEVITLVKKLISIFNDKGFQVFFILSPYHQTVFRSENKNNYAYLIEVERMIVSLAKEMEVPVYGSFDPQNVNCLPNEFFDVMHPTPLCLNKLMN